MQLMFKFQAEFYSRDRDWLGLNLCCIWLNIFTSCWRSQIHL